MSLDLEIYAEEIRYEAELRQTFGNAVVDKYTTENGIDVESLTQNEQPLHGQETPRGLNAK